MTLTKQHMVIFRLHNLKAILFSSQFIGSSVPLSLREHRKHDAPV